MDGTQRRVERASEATQDRPFSLVQSTSPPAARGEQVSYRIRQFPLSGDPMAGDRPGAAAVGKGVGPTTPALWRYTWRQRTGMKWQLIVLFGLGAVAALEPSGLGFSFPLRLGLLEA
jgi:hypothetical protein